MLNRNLPTQRRERHFDPWSSLQDEMRELFDRFSGDLTPIGETNFKPSINVQDKGKEYLVTAEIPGMSENDINITLEDDQLILQGEKRNEFKDEGKGFWKSEISYGSFYRAIPFSNDIDADKVSANYKDGVLKVTLAKKEGASSKAKKIQIGAGQSETSKKDVKH